MKDFQLLRDWDKIKDVRHSFDWFKNRWQYDWASNSTNASIMYAAIQLIKPKIIIETGTFEGHGVFVMAKALSDINEAATIHTIDYDGDPVTNLDSDSWNILKEIRTENLSIIRQRFKNVKIIFHDGDSRDILPMIINDYNIKWDFFYQDSMHFYEGIKAEWECVRYSANSNAIAVFDDISIHQTDWEQDGYLFCKEFINSKQTENWDYINTDVGHHQFWIQRNQHKMKNGNKE
jgi:cephalosporin hydroxylase